MVKDGRVCGRTPRFSMFMSARMTVIKAPGRQSRGPRRARGAGRPRRARARLTLRSDSLRPRDTDAHDEVRAYKVARARKLVRRKSYPSKRILKAVAGLLAQRLQS